MSDPKKNLTVSELDYTIYLDFFTLERGTAMSQQMKNPENERFVLRKHYKFAPPVETNCISVVGGEWKYKRFAEGWCLKYEEKTSGFVFQGKPVGEKVEHYFVVAWGSGSVAENIPPPKFDVVE